MIARYLIVFGIGVYRKRLRKLIGRTCLFKISCSEYVLVAARDKGALAAVRAFLRRWRTCRGDYQVEFDGNVGFLIASCGERIVQHELSDDMQRELSCMQKECTSSLAVANFSKPEGSVL